MRHRLEFAATLVNHPTGGATPAQALVEDVLATVGTFAGRKAVGAVASSATVLRAVNETLRQRAPDRAGDEAALRRAMKAYTELNKNKNLKLKKLIFCLRVEKVFIVSLNAVTS